MKIIIAGCGKIGTSVLSRFVDEKNRGVAVHDVVAVDIKQEVIDDMTNRYDIMGVCGNAVSQSTLIEAGVSSCGLFVAMTDSDELNMLSCFIAKRMGARHTIARIRNPEYNVDIGFLQKNLELSMAINPEYRTANELYNILKFPSALKIETFSRPNIEMIEFRLEHESEFIGKNLIEIRKKFDANFLICCVQRGEDVTIPGGFFTLAENDKIGVIASRSEMQKLMKELRNHRKQAKNIIILGGSKTAVYLARMFEATGGTAKIIEQDEKRCEELADELPGVMIIHGNGAEQELLNEYGLSTCDAFVALTGIDEENILVAAYAKTQDVPQTIAKINRDELVKLAENIGIGSFVSPRIITANILEQYARALENSSGSSHVETLYKIFGEKAEALEFAVSAESKLTGVMLRDLKLKDNLLVGGIVRGNKTIIPSGVDSVLPGDRVIIISSGNSISDIIDILK